ncbi:MAG: beta-N-acetylhexosaminidase [Leifsonia flava]
MSGAATTASVPDSDTLSSRGELRQLVAATLMPGFVGTELPDWLAARLRAGLGGVCVFGPNIVSRSQLRALTDAVRAANPRAVIAIDEEGGDVTRLYYDQGSPYPGPAVLGRLDDLQLTERVGRTVAEELAAVGCTLNFAPDADVNSNPDNPVIGVRSFGTDPVAVARHIGAWVTGHEGAGIAVSAKHFPGHGDTAQDSHLALPVIDADLETLRSRELVPFRAAIEAGARTIMTSHILIPQVDPEFPATHSRIILQGLLREELGFDGLIVSDALDMKGASGIHGIPEAAVRALDAGCDLLCIGTENTDAELGEIEDRVLAAIASGRLSIERVLEAALRVRELGEETNAVLAALDAGSNGASASTRADDDAPASEFAEPVFDTAQVQRAFDVSPHARAWLDAGIAPSAVVRIDTVANIAVGVAPWGPFAELARHPFRTDSAWSAPHALAEGSTALPDVPRPVIVVGKDIHRYAFARDAIDELRANGGAVLVVDLGWPSDDRAYADIATFGASRLLGRSVLALLEGQTA